MTAPKPSAKTPHTVADIRFRPGGLDGPESIHAVLRCSCGYFTTVGEWNKHRGPASANKGRDVKRWEAMSL